MKLTIVRKRTGFIFHFILMFAVLGSAVSAKAKLAHRKVSHHSQVLFEGYYKVLIGGKHVGYVIERYAVDRHQHFIYTSYTWVKPQKKLLIDATRDIADRLLRPISYRYKSIDGDKIKLIEARFVHNRIVGTLITDTAKNGVLNKATAKLQRIGKSLSANTFLSSFLVYKMLQSGASGKPSAPKGIHVGLKYEYSAIAEEIPELAQGIATVDSEKTYKGFKVFQITNDYEKGKWVSYLTPSGEVLAVKSPLQNISEKLVADAKDATEGCQVNQKTLKLLFGNIPAGKHNVLAQKK